MTIPRERYLSKTIFTRVPGWVTHGQGISAYSGSELKVLIYICAKADNHTNTSIVTREEISRNTKVSLGGISEILSTLATCGVIRIERDGRRNIYHVQFAPPASWPHCIPTNTGRARAADGRRATLTKNRESTPIKHGSQYAAPWGGQPQTPEGYSAKGLYGEAPVDNTVAKQ